MIRIVVADDHELIRDRLKRLLDTRENMRVVGTAASATELDPLLESCSCDIVILDLNLPDKNGLDVLKEIKCRYPALRVLVMSMHSEEMYAKQVRNNGAEAYLTKGSGSMEIVRAIEEVMQGAKPDRV